MKKQMVVEVIYFVFDYYIANNNLIINKMEMFLGIIPYLIYFKDYNYTVCLNLNKTVEHCFPS